MSASAKTVIAWRRDLLPGSETFVRSQISSLRIWEAVPVGTSKVHSAISSDGDRILYGTSPVERVRLKLFYWSQFSLRVYRLLREVRPDVVHAHFATDAVLIAPVCKALRIPVVVSLYGVDVTAAPTGNSFRSRVYRWRLRALFNYADRVMAVSQDIADRAIALGARIERTVVHRLGIELPPFSEPDLGKEWDICVVGRLVEKKGIRDLITASALLKKRDAAHQLRIVVVGSGPLLDELQAQAREAEVSVDFVGMLSPQEAKEVMRRSRVLAVPSRTATNGDREGLPMILLEGAALGMPIIASRHSGIPEAISHMENGLLFEEGNARDLARCISMLSDEALCTRLGIAARATVEERFNIDVQSARLEAIYSQASERNE